MSDHKQKLYIIYLSDFILLLFISLIVYLLFSRYTKKIELLQTEISEKDTRLVEQSRLAIIGDMINMLAHQWRQPLSVVAAMTANLKLKVMLEDCNFEKEADKKCYQEDIIQKLEKMERALQKLSSTINDFSKFYKPDTGYEKAFLTQLVDYALSIIDGSLKDGNITVNYVCNDDVQLRVYKNDMTQVVLNILKNAKDAFEKNNIEEPTIDIIINKNQIKICDNAGGIEGEVLNEIFDPYFSTKEERNNTGMSLYMSKLIIENHHNGSIDVKVQNDGLCFIITVNDAL